MQKSLSRPLFANCQRPQPVICDVPEKANLSLPEPGFRPKIRELTEKKNFRVFWSTGFSHGPTWTDIVQAVDDFATFDAPLTMTGRQTYAKSKHFIGF